MVYGTLLRYINKKYPNNIKIHRAFSAHYNTYLAELIKALPIYIELKDFKDAVNRLKTDKTVKKRNTGIYKGNLKIKTRLLLWLEFRVTCFFYVTDIIGKKIILKITSR